MVGSYRVPPVRLPTIRLLLTSNMSGGMLLLVINRGAMGANAPFSTLP
jgi:hypothetical protein